MVCSSKPLPRVAFTIAWVSPRVKSATPWGRGTREPRRRSAGCRRCLRPSIRSPVASTRSRIDLAAEVVQDVPDLACESLLSSPLAPASQSPSVSSSTFSFAILVDVALDLLLDRLDRRSCARAWP